MNEYEDFLVKNLEQRKVLKGQVFGLLMSSYNKELIDFLDYQIEKIQEEIDFHKDNVQ